MRVARGDEPGALEDTEIGLRDYAGDSSPQALVPALSYLAFVRARAGDAEGSASALAELAVTSRALEAPPAGSWVIVLAFALLELGREAEILRTLKELGPPTPWREAALTVRAAISSVRPTCCTTSARRRSRRTRAFALLGSSPRRAGGPRRARSWPQRSPSIGVSPRRPPSARARRSSRPRADSEHPHVARGARRR